MKYETGMFIILGACCGILLIFLAVMVSTQGETCADAGRQGIKLKNCDSALVVTPPPVPEPKRDCSKAVMAKDRYVNECLKYSNNGSDWCEKRYKIVYCE